MATNEILTFASTTTGTNLLTQSEYTADAQRLIGHQPGIARSKLENKVLRQASLLVAGLAQYLANKQTTNVTDSLTKEQIAEMLLNAIGADYLALNGGNSMTAKLRAKSGAASVENINDNGFVFAGDVDSGLFNPADGQLQVAINGVSFLDMQLSQAIKAKKQLRAPPGIPNNSSNSDAAGFAFGETGDTGLFLENSNSAINIRLNNSIVGSWTSSMKDWNSNGWAKMSNGTIIQWCQYAFQNPAGLGSLIAWTRNFPIAFPTACLSVNVSTIGNSNDGTEHIVLASGWTNTYYSGRAKRVYGNWTTGEVTTVLALAIGY